MGTTKKELSLILQEGEGYRIEFKESAVHLDREMAAFANGSGGRIFIGVTDSGVVKGIEITNKVKSQIQDIANNCEPPIKILFDEIDEVLIVEVREGADKPYKCSSGFYNRIGPNSQKLGRQEIIEFMKAESKIKFDEMINPHFSYKKDFDEAKFKKFLALAGISKVISNENILKNLGVAEISEGKTFLTNTGILFFAKNLADLYFHTVVTCVLYKGTIKLDVIDKKDFNEDIVSNIDETMMFLKRHLNLRYEFDGGLQRIEVPELPYEALREAVINAVIHRDYFEKGANVMVEIFDDRVDITSPGGLVKGLKPEEFGTKSMLRNPNIANILQRIKYIEKMGTGINRMQNFMKSSGMKPIKFEFSGFVTAVFNRAAAVSDVDGGINGGINRGINGGINTVLEYIKNNAGFRLPLISKSLEIPEKTVEKKLKALKKEGKIEYRGSKKTGGYYAIS